MSYIIIISTLENSLEVPLKMFSLCYFLNGLFVPLKTKDFSPENLGTSTIANSTSLENRSKILNQDVSILK